MTYATSDYVQDPKRSFRASLVSVLGVDATASIAGPNIVEAIQDVVLQIVQINHGLAAHAFRRHGAHVSATSMASLAIGANEETTVFNEFEALRSDDRTIRKLLAQLRATNEIPYRDRLTARIEQLLEAYKEDMDGRVFSADSLSDLIAFLASARGLKYPAVTLTRGGDLFLSWKREKSHVFSVQFLKTKQCRFAIIRPNERNVGQSEQFSGITTALSLMDFIEHFNVADWAAE